MFQDSIAVQASNPVQAPPAGQFERYVFVYGTLRRGGSNDINLRKPAPRYVGTASLLGMLYDLGPYPGLILGSVESSDPSVQGAGKVIGEVYAVSPALEDNLDELEGLLPVPTGEYFKRLLTLNVGFAGPVMSLGGEENAEQALSCIVYEINPERTHGCALVDSGDWIAYCHKKRATTATR